MAAFMIIQITRNSRNKVDASKIGLQYPRFLQIWSSLWAIQQHLYHIQYSYVCFLHYKAAVYSTLLLRKEIGSDSNLDI